MRVVHVSTSDRNGGASIAAYRLHKSMLAGGISSVMLVQNRIRSDGDSIHNLSKFDKLVMSVIRVKFESLIHGKIIKKFGLFSIFKYGVDLSKRSEILEADIIYLHWVNGGFQSLKSLQSLLRLGKPVFWFLHDMFPFTGGCHYSFTCEKYKIGCYKCMMFIQRKYRDSSFVQFAKKKKLYSLHGNLHFVAPSKWMFDCASQSLLLKNNQVHYIPNTIDTNLFRSVDRMAGRFLFGVEHFNKIILFGADSALTNPYKGFSYFRDSLSTLFKRINKNDKIAVVVFGSDFNPDIAKVIPCPVFFVGRMYDDYSLIMLYNLSDVFVIPSLAENFPNTILECLSCGTPVVGFDIGGIPDLISEETGRKAKYQDSVDLAEKIYSVLYSRKKYKTSEIIRKNYSYEVILQLHKKIW